ncbi:MAG: 30S ribosomal protein S21 [Oligoflexales bacterium]|nr:30S ribosomal protein S21 [Oligoflexales bacterium]
MPGVIAKEDQQVEIMMKIFKKQVEKAGTMAELKRRASYEKPSVKRKKKSLMARKRLLKQVRKFVK